jgi:hypothetical protein
MTLVTKEAMDNLKATMQSDPEYAWAWHCNIAMPFKDATGCTHEQANKGAARVMEHFFSVDITKHPHWQYERNS